ncbi:alpha/beta hydrolase [Alphaproteobacteria bacterium KMM 3653]|uniref:Alpha/beta hydrolase n=1 Tax=Harenicola maris TaxID=2841044 RepID=A0AAP2CT86_9RHOB|nr:alpha/beta hydrolase [Harenicola maris]
MPLVQISARNRAAPISADQARAIQKAHQRLAPEAPILIMVHGFKYAPDCPGHCPFDSLFAPQNHSAYTRSRSWPHALGLRPGRESATEPLCIGFGWQGRGALHRVYRRAAQAGQALAGLIEDLAALAPGRRIDLMAHSMGARVVLSALPRLRPGLLGTAILMAGAEFRKPAEAALASPAGQSLQLINIISRENWLFDYMFEWALAPHLWRSRSLGRGLGRGLIRGTAARVDLPIDDTAALSALKSHGLTIAPRQKRICHWSVYLRPGIFGLYRRLLLNPALLPELHQSLRANAQPTRRLQWITSSWPPLPFGGKSTS